jgi:GTP:adenosylcobinamide-phosphate guanylyltransferase
MNIRVVMSSRAIGLQVEDEVTVQVLLDGYTQDYDGVIKSIDYPIVIISVDTNFIAYNQVRIIPKEGFFGVIVDQDVPDEEIDIKKCPF